MGGLTIIGNKIPNVNCRVRFVLDRRPFFSSSIELVKQIIGNLLPLRL